MKIKGDFVTNSSSTSFTFIFKGGKRENLFEGIKENSKLFNLKYLGEQCNSDEILEDIKSVLRKRKWGPKITTLESLISEEEKHLQRNKEEIKNLKGKNKKMWIKSFKRWDDKLETMVEFLEGLKERGFDSSFEMEWGNQPGIRHIQGGNTGKCMYGKGPKKAVRKNLVVYNMWSFTLPIK